MTWKEQLKEIAGFALVLAILTLVPAAIAAYEHSRADVEEKLFEMTAIGKTGLWTLEPVQGHNYWRRNWEFEPATIVVRVGDRVRLRLTSADVQHSFSIPKLRIRPVMVKPGTTTDVVFEAEESGAYTFLCYLVCGKCHQRMMGTLIILDEDETLEDYEEDILPLKECVGESEEHGISAENSTETL